MKFLLVTDLDNTLVGDHAATIALNLQLAGMRERVHLVYATGRSFYSFGQLCQEFMEQAGQSLLTPDDLITGVGSEIYRQHQASNLSDSPSTYQFDPVWANQLSQNWHRLQILELAATWPALVLQAEAEQNPWKLSYFVQPGGKKSAQIIVEQFQQKLATQGLAAEVIFSSNQDLDILPYKVNKGEAMRYLQGILQIPPAATLVCGDSGNDISLFTQGTLGVIVNNAQPELLSWYEQHRHPSHYRAGAGYAAGIQEALHHFKLI